MSKIRDKLVSHLEKRSDAVDVIWEKMNYLADSYSNDTSKKQMMYIAWREILYLLHVMLIWMEFEVCNLVGKVMSVFGY